MSTNLSKAYHSEKGNLLEGHSDKYNTTEKSSKLFDPPKLGALTVSLLSI